MLEMTPEVGRGAAPGRPEIEIGGLSESDAEVVAQGSADGCAESLVVVPGGTTEVRALDRHFRIVDARSEARRARHFESGAREGEFSISLETRHDELASQRGGRRGEHEGPVFFEIARPPRGIEVLIPLQPRQPRAVGVGLPLQLKFSSGRAWWLCADDARPHALGRRRDDFRGILRTQKVRQWRDRGLAEADVDEVRAPHEQREVRRRRPVARTPRPAAFRAREDSARHEND
mmetsp:Transcript_5223/g.21504  ORF Transcript_5223/g.21504 Transcript_5223/m.21504 type:complete len:233 (+) Transcript_5223:137-835(+)